MIYSISRLKNKSLDHWTSAATADAIMRFVRYSMINERQDCIYIGLHGNDGMNCGTYKVEKYDGVWKWCHYGKHDDITSPALEKLLSEVAVRDGGW